jgi:hypothetical protein
VLLNKSNVFLLVILFLAVFPPAIIFPIDWVYYQFTGINYVDITNGMIAYFLYLPIVTLLILLFIIYRIFIKKIAVKENIQYLLSLVILLFFTVFRLTGFG